MSQSPRECPQFVRVTVKSERGEAHAGAGAGEARRVSRLSRSRGVDRSRRRCSVDVRRRPDRLSVRTRPSEVGPAQPHTPDPAAPLKLEPQRRRPQRKAAIDEGDRAWCRVTAHADARGPRRVHTLPGNEL